VLAVGSIAAAAAAAADSNVRFAAQTPVVTMAEWEVRQSGAAEQTGARVLIAAGPAELARAPADAVRYESQSFRFANGEIRLLTFHKATGGVLHQVTTETQLYVVKGSAVVGVAGQVLEIHSGDVVSLPSGVVRSIAGQPEDTTLVLHTVRSAQGGAKAALVRASEAPASPLTSGPKVGDDSVKVSVQRYNFDGNSIRVARLVGPGKTGVVTPTVDALIYLLSGRMEITIGEEVKVVQAGDAVCEAAGLATHWNVLEPSSFIATNGAKAAP
jgi:quercetin dioxygenase-like cupin family protein